MADQAVESPSVDAVASPHGASVGSPCVDICTLDSDFVCIGCGRSIEEILKWQEYTPDQQKAVLDRIFGAKLKGFAAGN